MPQQWEGYVDHIIYRNEENGYTVFEMSGVRETGGPQDGGHIPGSDVYTCVGTFLMLDEGAYLSVTGTLTSHPLYGEQIKVTSFREEEPKDVAAMERYLGSGAVKGIGEALAGRIIKRFHEDTFRIIEEEPERLAEIKGISERKAREIALQFSGKRDLRNAMIYLADFGISNRLAVKIYEQYKEGIYQVLKDNPYRMAEDIDGIGFRIADNIAMKAGFRADGDFRVKAGILYTLEQEAAAGNVYLPEALLYARTAELLGVSSDQIGKYLMDLQIDRKIIVSELPEGRIVYAAHYYYLEMNAARMLLDLAVPYRVDDREVQKKIAAVEAEEKIELDEMQRKAVLAAAGNGLLVLTGGPGTGKTTTINTMIHYFEQEGMDILLAAPTGRAAKRMSETTGMEAQTIHRLLEVSGMSEDGAPMHFDRNEENPLETDVLIVDEMSMVDISLMNYLLRAVSPGTRLILVGDVNQLPSVGPGNVLADIIRSEAFCVVSLTKIFRQAAESDIVVNAHKINRGEAIAMDNKSRDFFLLQRSEVRDILGVVVTLLTKKLPPYVHADTYDLQVLTPMRKGDLGVESLNHILQHYLNPESPEKKEVLLGDTQFREGDKVMQIRNNYQLTWEVRSTYGTPVRTGTGVFNGDMGRLREINTFAEILTVEFDDGRVVEYPYTGADELELAYAITIHKSQGSEYPAVVIPILSGPRMLLTRNLLYTAVTRAKSCVTLVGSRKTVEDMIANEGTQRRYSALDRRIRDMKAQDSRGNG